MDELGVNNATLNSTTVVRSIYKFTVGFISGLFGDQAPNTMMCTGNFTRIANASISLYDHIVAAANSSAQMATIDIYNRTIYNETFPLYTRLQNETRGNLSLSAIDFENIFASVHPIVFGCYSSVNEFAEITMAYIHTFEDW